MAEEKYDRKWHEGYDPKADKKKYFLTDVIDYIDDTGGTALKNWWEDERKLEGWERLNPISIGTFGATRAVEGVGWVLTNTPGVKQAVGGLARAEDIAAGTAGDLVGLANIDPRVGGWGVRAATAWYGGPVAAKGVAKVAKATGIPAKVSKGVSRVAGALDETAGEIAQRTRARRAHRWTRPGDKGTPIDRSDVFKADDLTGPQKTYTRITDPKKPGAIPPDPWNPPDLQAHLFNYIDSTADVIPPANPSVDDILRIQEQLTGKRTSLLGEYTSKAVIGMPQMMEKPARRRSIYRETFEKARSSFSELELQTLENELVLNWGMKDRTFRWDQYQARIGDKAKGKADKRRLGAMFESVPFTKVNYDIVARERMPQLRKYYAPILKDIGLKPGDFQLHHQQPILASLPGYDGLRFGSDEWWDVTELLWKKGLRAGDHERNLKPLIGGSKASKKNVLNKKVLDTQGRFETPHSVTHKYLDTQVGPDGTLFWKKDVRDRMNGVGKWEGKGPDHQFRLDKWDEYADIVNKSIDITNQAEQTFIDLYHRNPALKNVPINPDELDLVIERLVKLEEDGLLKPELIEGKWQVNQMESIVSEVTEELQKSQADFNYRAVFGRDGLLQKFVDQQEITSKELRSLDKLPLSEQLEALQKYTGMTIADIDLLIQTQPNFDPIKFIKDNR